MGAKLGFFGPKRLNHGIAWTNSMHGIGENNVRCSVGELNGRDHFGDLDIDGMIVLVQSSVNVPRALTY